MRKYPRHSQLDVMKVLKLVPEGYKLSLKKGGNALFYFLQSAISNILHEERTTKCTKHMSEQEKLQIEAKLIMKKKSYVRITKHKDCAVCKKKIGDKVFVVYPNGVVARQSCISNEHLQMHVCPKTG